MSRQPVLFVSHGAPTFAVEPGRAGALLQALGERMAPPRCVLVVSPHWMTQEFAVTVSERPDTIHDFGGFPAELYTLRYDVAGAPDVAARVAELLAPAGVAVRSDPERGLDHGAWVPMMHLRPRGDVPVIQLSMPAALDAASAWQLGELLAPLRDEGVLILGSGSLTHNLHETRRYGDVVQEYARAFVDWARAAVMAHDRAALVGYLTRAPQAQRAHPTSEHYLPLLVACGAAAADEPVDVIDGGILRGVLSMESYVIGAVPRSA